MRNPLDQLLVGATTLGLLSGIFEEFYVQSRHGRWMRQLHTVLEIMVHSLFVLVLFFLVMYINHAIFGRIDQIPTFIRESDNSSNFTKAVYAPWGELPLRRVAEPLN